MSAFRYDWEDPADSRDVYDRFTRPAQRWPEHADDDDEGDRPARGKPFTQAELDNFFQRGGTVNYGEARLAKQQTNDQRYEERKKRNLLIDLVVDVVATWDSSKYLEQHRRTAREILTKPCNQRRRKLSGMSPMQRRHQRAIRLAHALAFDGVDQAGYCRLHGFDSGSASRMLADLYEKEPLLHNAIDSISACAALTSWQNRQQRKHLSNRDKKIELLYGWKYRESADTGELCDYDVGGIRVVIGGQFKPCALLRDEPFEPPNLHEPATWHDMHVPRLPLMFADDHYVTERLLIPVAERWVALDWSTLYEPMRKVQRYEPLPDRYREISRVVTNIKTGKRETWVISRALDRTRPPLDPEPDIVGAAWMQWASQVQAQALELPHFIRRPPKLVTDGAYSRCEVRESEWDARVL